MILLSKTFILSGDEYKKYDKGSPAVDGDVNVIPIMTSDIAPSGVASASSQYDSTLSAFKAFDGALSNSGWVASDGAMTGWLAYEFRASKKINSYSIVGRGIVITSAPKSWTFEGTDDNGENWIVLDNQVNQVDWIENMPNKYSFINDRYFKKYRINVTANNGFRYVSIEELEMFELMSSATPSSWKTVSPTLPTLPQFQEEGMDDLSVFDRKVQPVLESPQEMTSSVLGEGKVFKGTVDLKKYFDLRKLEVK